MRERITKDKAIEQLQNWINCNDKRVSFQLESDNPDYEYIGDLEQESAIFMLAVKCIGMIAGWHPADKEPPSGVPLAILIQNPKGERMVRASEYRDGQYSVRGKAKQESVIRWMVLPPVPDMEVYDETY